MIKILYYETVFKKGIVIGSRPEYGVGAWWLIYLIMFCEKISIYFLQAKIYLEQFVKIEKGKLEK